MLQLIYISLFITIFLFAFAIGKYIMGNQSSIKRIKKYTSIEEIREESKKDSRKEFKMGFGIISKSVGSAKFLDGYKKSIQLQLTRAHLLLKPEEYITICIVIAFTLGLVVFVFSSSMPMSKASLFALIGGVIGWLTPTYVVKSKIKKRMKLLNEQLSDVISLMSNSLKAGYSFFQVIDTVAKEMSGPIADEFLLLQKEINLGLATEKALENLVLRVSSDDLGLIVTAVLIQRQVGGNLSEILENISVTIRDRVKIKGEIKTLTAQGRMSGIIIAILPPALGLIIYLINPEHMSVLFTNPIGWGIIGFSIMMELTGIFFISKIVKIEI